MSVAIDNLSSTAKIIIRKLYFNRVSAAVHLHYINNLIVIINCTDKARLNLE